MLPGLSLPVSVTALLAAFRPCFTAPTFETFTGLVAGFLGQTGRRTVCGMLTGAGLSRLWPHDRAHRFFAGARWPVDEVCLVLARLVVSLLVPEGEPVRVVVDDTLFKRSGRKVWAASWFHDGSAKDAKKVGFGNNWVVVGIIVTLPFMTRPVCLPVMAKLVVKRTTSASRLRLAARAARQLAEALPGRTIHVVADAAYAGKELAGLPKNVTWTTRLRKDAALYDLAPPRTGKRGRPALKGKRLPTLAALAKTLTFTETTVQRYRKTETVQIATLTCLWYSVFGPQHVQVILVKEADGFVLALVTTDLTATPTQVVQRYASRWSIEVAIEDAKQLFGVGEAHNRTAEAVRRTVPFALACQTLTILWYATAGHHPDDAAEHRTRAPWYQTKTHPSTADMIAKLRRVFIAARFQAPHPGQPTATEIHTLRLAWATEAA